MHNHGALLVVFMVYYRTIVATQLWLVYDQTRTPPTLILNQVTPRPRDPTKWSANADFPGSSPAWAVCIYSKGTTKSRYHGHYFKTHPFWVVVISNASEPLHSTAMPRSG